MQNLDTSLVCLETASLAVGYKALHWLTREQELRVLEASPAGPRFLILALGKNSDAVEALRRVRGSFDIHESELLVDQVVVADVCQPVMEGLYSLPQTALDESLLVIDCPSVSGLLDIAQTLAVREETRIIELKVMRTAPGGAYGFFTGNGEQCRLAAEAARAQLRKSVREGRIELIENPSSSFRSFFNLSGE